MILQRISQYETDAHKISGEKIQTINLAQYKSQLKAQIYNKQNDESVLLIK